MTINPDRPQDYRLRNGCEVVRIIPTPEHFDSGKWLLVLYQTDDRRVFERWSYMDGSVRGTGYEHWLDLIPAATNPEETQ